MEQKRNKSCRFTVNEEENIIQEYQDGASMATLGKKYDCSPTTIKNILNAWGMKGRSLSAARRNYLKYTIDETVFEKIDNPNSAYWLGVMYSDGYITKKQYTNSFGISVQKSDEEWLLKFKNFLQYSGEVKTYVQTTGYSPNTEYVRLLIGNNKIVSDLEKWGVVEHKTKKINSLPKINFLDDFIRGYIDGDGALVKKTPRLIICGNKDFLLEIADYFNLPYHIYEDKTIWNIQYNKKETQFIEKRLYENAEYFLQRKYDIAKRSFNSPLTLEEVKANPEYQGKPLEH